MSTDLTKLKRELQPRIEAVVEELSPDLDWGRKDTVVHVNREGSTAGENGGAPTTSYHVEELIWPSSLIAIDVERGPESPTRDLAEWFYHSDHGYEVHLENEGGLSKEEIKEHTIIEYQQDLTDLIGLVMDCAGDFDEDAYEFAFKQELATKYSSKLCYALAPIEGITMSQEKIEFSIDADWMHYELQNDLESITLRECTSEDLSAIASLSWGSPPNPMEFANISHVIVVKHRGIQKNRKLCRDVCNMLRLSKPYERHISAHRVLSGSYGRQHYRFGYPDFWSSAGSRETSNFPEYEIDSTDIGKLQSNWEKYGGFLHKSDGDSLSRALRRFNQMYEKRHTEDRILDGMMAIESSLVQDISGGYKYHIPTRGTLLLKDFIKYESKFIYDFLLDLYDVRNDIVHENKEIGQREVLGETFSPRRYIRVAREIIGRILIAYMDYNIEGESIAHANVHGLDAQLTRLIRNSDRLLEGSSIE